MNGCLLKVLSCILIVAAIATEAENATFTSIAGSSAADQSKGTDSTIRSSSQMMRDQLMTEQIRRDTDRAKDRVKDRELYEENERKRRKMYDEQRAKIQKNNEEVLAMLAGNRKRSEEAIKRARESIENIKASSKIYRGKVTVDKQVEANDNPRDDRAQTVPLSTVTQDSEATDASIATLSKLSYENTSNTLSEYDDTHIESSTSSEVSNHRQLQSIIESSNTANNQTLRESEENADDAKSMDANFLSSSYVSRSESNDSTNNSDVSLIIAGKEDTFQNQDGLDYSNTPPLTDITGSSTVITEISSPEAIESVLPEVTFVGDIDNNSVSYMLDTDSAISELHKGVDISSQTMQMGDDSRPEAVEVTVTSNEAYVPDLEMNTSLNQILLESESVHNRDMHHGDNLNEILPIIENTRNTESNTIDLNLDSEYVKNSQSLHSILAKDEPDNRGDRSIEHMINPSDITTVKISQTNDASNTNHIDILKAYASEVAPFPVQNDVTDRSEDPLDGIQTHNFESHQKGVTDLVHDLSSDSTVRHPTATSNTDSEFIPVQASETTRGKLDEVIIPVSNTQDGPSEEINIRKQDYEMNLILPDDDALSDNPNDKISDKNVLVELKENILVQQDVFIAL